VPTRLSGGPAQRRYDSHTSNGGPAALRTEKKLDSSAVHWPSFLRELDATEKAWMQYEVRYPREDAVHWMPAPMPLFITLLTDAVMAAQPHHAGPRGGWADEDAMGPPWFLDVGCGPGTKIRLAQKMFGLKGYGIDIVPRFVAEAQAHGVHAMIADAFEFPEGGLSDDLRLSRDGYARFQIVYVNRPSALQDELEHLVMDQMASDAVLIAVNWRNDPAKEGWILNSQEFGDPVCGTFIKP
jgi:SAM-dependent methyltransferase